MPLRLSSAGDIANVEIGLFYALLLLYYHGSPLFYYSLLGRYATREHILILAVALELAALLLIIGGRWTIASTVSRCWPACCLWPRR